jgi:hypothetical protein
VAAVDRVDRAVAVPHANRVADSAATDIAESLAATLAERRR